MLSLKKIAQQTQNNLNVKVHRMKLGIFMEILKVNYDWYYRYINLCFNYKLYFLV